MSLGSKNLMKPRDLRFISNEVRQRQKNLQETTDGIPTVTHDVECPVCKQKMSLKRHAIYGLFWACPTYAACGTSHGARSDGSPLGRPASRETKEWRVKAHKVFDQIWQSGEMSRAHAYMWLGRVMGKTIEGGHIALFTIEECQELIQHVKRRA